MLPNRPIKKEATVHLYAVRELFSRRTTEMTIAATQRIIVTKARMRFVGLGLRFSFIFLIEAIF
jgi:hypothetical protein